MTVSLLLLALAVVVVWLALRMRRATGIPWAHVVASDTGGGEPLQKPLFARRYMLTGKPDYLLHIDDRYVPVEVKPGRRAAQPYESDLMQVAAYCLLVEEEMDCTPPYGLLRYADTSFRVAYTPAVRDRLLSLLDTMRNDLTSENCARSHTNPHRCAGCGFVAMCEEALVE